MYSKSVSIVAGFLLLANIPTAIASTIDDLQAKIADTTAQKEALEKEIASYEAQIADVSSQATSLSVALKVLDVTIQKNTLNIKLTENKIQAAELQIEDLSNQIDQNIALIDANDRALAGLIAELNRTDTVSLVENLLKYRSISDFWNQIETISQVENQIRQKTEETKDTKTRLETNKKATEAKRKELMSLKASLEDQKTVLELSKKEKQKLLADTKNKQSNYEKILAQKKALSLALDNELVDFQSQLKFAIDPNSYPAYHAGILHWPLDVIKITQKFGVTDFSKTTNAYNGKGHNGVDFGAPIGTPVKAALSGTILGTGDTDTVCPGASFGRWIFIQHGNGLSTIYAHLSLIKVRAGDTVSTGDIIGYTGLTGFTTGPHLHFGVYVSQGTRILSLKSRVCNGTYTVPVADLQAYLDPLQYL